MYPLSLLLLFRKLQSSRIALLCEYCVKNISQGCYWSSSAFTAGQCREKYWRTGPKPHHYQIHKTRNHSCTHTVAFHFPFYHHLTEAPRTEEQAHHIQQAHLLQDIDSEYPKADVCKEGKEQKENKYSSKSFQNALLVSVPFQLKSFQSHRLKFSHKIPSPPLSIQLLLNHCKLSDT